MDNPNDAVPLQPNEHNEIAGDQQEEANKVKFKSKKEKISQKYKASQ